MFVGAGLAFALVVRDTAVRVALELAQHPKPSGDTRPGPTFARTSWRDRSLRGASQAGLVNNLNDDLTWGAFPLLCTDHGLGIAAVGVIKGLYPVLWGIGQIPTGHLADRIAMVYPALIASVSDPAHPSWRANALGTYRFWRDIGYAAGALVAGVLADSFGLTATVIAAAALTAASGLLAGAWISEHPGHAVATPRT